MWDFLHCRCPCRSWQPGLPPAQAKRRGPPTARSARSSEDRCLGMGWITRHCAGWDAAWSASRRGSPRLLGRKKVEIQRGSCKGHLERCLHAPLLPPRRHGQDVSHFPCAISKAVETDTTIGNSRETCRGLKLLLQGCADLPESPSNLSWTLLETMKGFHDPGEDHMASKLIFSLPIFLYFSALVKKDWEIYLPAPTRTSNLVYSSR